MYIAAGDVRKRLSQQFTAPRKTRFNKDPDDPSGTLVYLYMYTVVFPAVLFNLCCLPFRNSFSVERAICGEGSEDKGELSVWSSS